MESVLKVENWRVEAQTLELAATLTRGGNSIRAWFKVPETWRESVTPAADPFLVGLLFPLMEKGGEVVVKGTASPSLLANLELFMAIWHKWEPKLYRPVKIRADKELEQPAPTHPEEFLFPFSGGVDCCYSFLRHHRKLLGHRTKVIGATAMVHGFDIPLNAANSNAVFEKFLADVSQLLNPLSMAQIPIRNNLRQFPADWIHAHFTTLIASLHLFSKRFGGILFSNSVPITQLGTRWGSHPAMDPLLGKRHFAVIDDAAEVYRHEKTPLIYQWPEAWKRLHVCSNTPGDHANCCHCEKCIRTVLGFKLMDVPRPPTFPEEPTLREIRKVRLNHVLKRNFWDEMYEGFVERGKEHTALGRAVRATIRRGRRRHRMEPIKQRFIPLRNAIRKIFRGSAKSKAQLQTIPADNV